MKYLQFIGIAATALMVLACSPKEDPEGVIPQGHEDAVKKAQGVEDTLQNALGAQSEAMNQADN